jgi:hypothetical protein
MIVILFLLSRLIDRADFDGTLSESIVELAELRVLAISASNLSGKIPTHFGLLKYLIAIDLQHNNFIGKCNTIVSDRNQFSHHLFSGTFPSIKQLSSLSTFKISNNHFTGSLELPESVKIL